MAHEMEDLKHNDTFKREHAHLLARDEGTILLSAFGRKGTGKTTLLTALSLVLRAAGFKAEESTRRGGEHTLVISGAKDQNSMGRLSGVTMPDPAEAGRVVFRATERQFREAQEERDAWKRVAEGAGVCMTCALGSPDPMGCTDCLGTTWRDGGPPGFVPDNGPAVSQSPHKNAIRVISDGGKRWRIQGEGWVMQPMGCINAAEAREICERAWLGLAPQRRVTPEEDALGHIRGDTVIDRPVVEEPAVPVEGEGWSEAQVEAASAAFYDSMIGPEAKFWPHHDGWNGKAENFKERIRARMKLALLAALKKDGAGTGGHKLFKTGDTDAPEPIKDRNGEVVLDLCRVCGKAESELSEPCVTPRLKRETLTEARLARLEGWAWAVTDGEPLPDRGNYRRMDLNQRVEDARKREA